MPPSSPIGEAGGPLLVFGGPYSNLEATRAVLDEARRRAIPPDRMICTGDLAAYCTDPQGTIDLLREARRRTIMGNCEELLAADAGPPPNSPQAAILSTRSRCYGGLEQ